MEEIFSYKKTLNWKKIIIVIVIVVLAILRNENTGENQEEPSKNILNISTTSTFIDQTNHLELELPKKYNLKQVTSDSDNYVLELRAPNALGIFVSFEGFFSGTPITDLILKDREYYLSNYENTSNESDVFEDTINNIKVYYYSFDYTNSEKNYILETVWVESDIGYFIMDITYLTDDLDKYSNLRTDIINSITFLKNENIEAED